MASSLSSSSSRNFSFDVFPSFSGEDVRKTFLSHFLKELDRKLIIAFKDNEIERSRSLDPELRQAINDSRIAVVIFSKNYASSSWCLNELLEIVKCKEECSQMVIPVFYGLDPSHVRKQTGDFGKIFDETCQHKTEGEIIRWRGALTDAANILGYHSVTCANEAKMIDEIANDVLGKLNLNPSDEFKDYVGIENHIRAMSSLLHLESKEVRMVGIWGPSGIGKTTIARTLFSRLSRQFQSSIFIDKVFMEAFRGANLGDYNMKLHLQRTFLAEVLDKKDIKIDHFGAMENMLKHRKTLIFIDDLDDQDVLDALVGRTQWFGSGSRIILVTKDKHVLRAHGIDHIYEVCLPSKDLALEMFCRSAFRKHSPPDGFMELASEVVLHAGNLPLGLHILGSNLRGRDKQDWLDMLPRVQNGLDGKIERTLRVSYDGLNNKKDKAIFRHIACLFNGKEVEDIKMLLANCDLNVNIGLKNLVNKSLIRETWNKVEMHALLQEMGKEIVRSQSDEPGEREFLVDSKDICKVLEENTGTKSVLGISLNMDELNELHVHESAFEKMRNLCFLVISGNRWRLQLPKNFDYLPPKLKLLCWYGYPMSCMPSKFRPENLVKLKMRHSMLEKLWEGVVSLPCLKEINLSGSANLKGIPDLSKATNLEKICLMYCSSLLELPPSIRSLKKLRDLDMAACTNLKTIPSGIYLKYLHSLDFSDCSELTSFPEISEQYLTQTSIEEFPYNLRFQNLEPFTFLITTLVFSNTPNLLELPSSFQNLNNLESLSITDCENLETLPTGIDLQLLEILNLSGCSRLRSFPNISTNILWLNLSETAIEEIPLWIENFSRLSVLDMKGCKNLETLPTSISLRSLENLDLSGCSRLKTFPNISRYIHKLDLSQTAIEEVPGWINCFFWLFELKMSGCKNLETLPTVINIQSLNELNLCGCSRLRSFPNISTNISELDLSETAIEEVPWWIENFSRLKKLCMRGCHSLQRIALNILKLKHFRRGDFSNCGALTEASCNEAASPIPKDFFSKVELDFGCLNFDPIVIRIRHEQAVFMKAILSDEEVPSYFSHRTTGTCLTNIPLPHISPSQPFLRFKACALCDNKAAYIYTCTFKIQVCFRFVDISGNHFDYTELERRFGISELGDHLVVFDCFFPLNKDITPLADQLNYDHVDIQFRLIGGEHSDLQIKGCGIQLVQSLGNQNSFPHVWRGNTSNNAYLGSHETKRSVECVDRDEKTERNSKRMRIK